MIRGPPSSPLFPNRTLFRSRSELPAEAQPPMVEVQKADRPYASFYLSFTSSAREIPALTDWLTRNLQPQLTTRSEEHTSELQSQSNLVCRLLLETKNSKTYC